MRVYYSTHVMNSLY